jgi:F-type H+-transporting ATPase subunit O
LLQYTAAAKSSTLDTVARSLTSLNQILKSDTKLSPILHAPSLTDSDRSAIVAELEKHTGGADKGGTMKNFLQTLAENNRLGLLEGVCEKFQQLMGAHRGEMELVITSASKLDERMARRVEQAVAKSEYSQGKKIKVVTKVRSAAHPFRTRAKGARALIYCLLCVAAKEVSCYRSTLIYWVV